MLVFGFAKEPFSLEQLEQFDDFIADESPSPEEISEKPY